MAANVNKELVDRYVQDGAVVLRSVVPDDWLCKLRDITEAVMIENAKTSFEHEKTGQGRFFEDQFMWRRHDSARDFAFKGPLAAIAAKLMQSQSVRLFYDHILSKEPGTTTPTPWHNDMSYYHLQGDQMCSMWVALDAVTADTCVQYWRGSHADPRHFHITNFAGEESYDHSTSSPLPDVDQLVEDGKAELLTWNLQPGDVLVHHGFLIHGAPGNKMASRRRGYVMRWLGDDITFDARPGTINKGWIELGYDNGLEHGDKIDCALHPQVDLC